MGYKSPTYKKNDEHYSPKWLFDYFDVVFDIDVCAPPNGVSWIPAKKIYTEADDGLTQNWNGLVWMNPPYSKTTPWIDKWIEHKNGIALVPITATRWFRKLWMEAEILVVPKERIKFERVDGSKKYIIWETVLAGIGQGAHILNKSQIGRPR